MKYFNFDLQDKAVKTTLKSTCHYFLQTFVIASSNAHLDSNFIYENANIIKQFEQTINTKAVLTVHTLAQVFALKFALSVYLNNDDTEKTPTYVSMATTLIKSINQLANQHPSLLKFESKINSHKIIKILDQEKVDLKKAHSGVV